MTIPTANIRMDYAGNGSTFTFPYTYKAFANTDLRVLLTEDATGVPVTQTLTTHYTVSGVGSESGGNVVMVTAPPVGYTLTILATIANTQTTDLVNETRFYQSRIEDRMDKLCRADQVQAEKHSRSMVLPESEAGDPTLTTLPPLAERKGKNLSFDPTTAQPTASSPASAAVSVAMEPVVGSATLDLAFAVFGRQPVLATTVHTNGQVNIGGEPVSAPTTRDGTIVSRYVYGPTDCHGFADRTIIDAVSDYGGYGSFDCTVELRGNNAHNHIFSFQDRTKYNGSLTIDAISGFYSRPEHAGSGVIAARYGADIGDVSKTGTGSVTANIGVYVRNQKAAASNVGINVAETAGTADYAIYAGGGARSYHKGILSVGAIDDTGDGVAFTARGNNVTGPRAFLHSTSSNVQVGSIGGDFAYQVLTNGAVRLEVTPSSGAYTFRPGADNSQPLGDVTKRWSQLFAGTATINTSDAREKQDIRELEAREIAVAKRLNGLMRVFRFRDAVDKKGDAARIHSGVIAQEVAGAFVAEGLDPLRYAAVCHDVWEAQPAQLDDEGVEIVPAQAAGERWGIRYEELLCFMMAAL